MKSIRLPCSVLNGDYFCWKGTGRSICDIIKHCWSYQIFYRMQMSSFSYSVYILNIWCIPSKHSSWWRRLKDVLKTSFVFVFRRRLAKTSLRHFQDVFKTSCKSVFKAFSRRLQEVLKTSSRHLAKTSSRRLQYVFKTFSRCLQDIFKTVVI